MKPFILSFILGLFSGLLSAQIETSECLKQSASLYEIRDVVPLSKGHSLVLKLRHDPGKTAIILERYNESLELEDKKQKILRGDFINFFTYDFKDVHLSVTEDYVYVFLCERDNDVYKLHGISLYLDGLDDLAEPQIVSKMNNARLYNTNLRSPFDGYFHFSVDQYSHVIVTGVESRNDVFKKKNSKIEHKVKIHRHSLDCELVSNWEFSYEQSYHSEYEIVDVIIVGDKEYHLEKKSLENESYKYQFNIISYDLASGAKIAEIPFKNPRNGFINELRLLKLKEELFLAGAYYKVNHKRSSGVLISQIDLKNNEIVVVSAHDFCSEEILEASYFEKSKIKKSISKGEHAELPHFLIEHLIQSNKGIKLIGNFISKKASHHFRHQFFEYFDGTERNISNNESLKGGMLGVYSFDEDLTYDLSFYVPRYMELPQGYMRTIIDNRTSSIPYLYLNNHETKSVLRHFEIKSVQELSTYRIDLNTLVDKKVSSYPAFSHKKRVYGIAQTPDYSSNCVKLIRLTP